VIAARAASPLGARLRNGYCEIMARKAKSARKSARRPSKRKPAKRTTRRARIGQIFTGDQALHELFREEAAALLDNAEIGEEEKQSILAAMTCPCCGAGTMSVSVKLRPRARFIAEES
jgi:hypothetical protein